MQGQSPCSEQSRNLAILINVNAIGSRNLRQAGHGNNIARKRDHKARTGGQTHAADVQREARGRAQLLGIIGEGVLRLGDADRAVAPALLGQLGQLLEHTRIVSDVRRTIDALGNRFNLLLQGELVGISKGRSIVGLCINRRGV